MATFKAGRRVFAPDDPLSRLLGAAGLHPLRAAADAGGGARRYPQHRLGQYRRDQCPADRQQEAGRRDLLLDALKGAVAVCCWAGCGAGMPG
jgi:hypothetical protein